MRDLPLTTIAETHASALGLQLALVVADEGTNLVGHVEQLGPLLLVERHRERPIPYTERPPFSLTFSVMPRLCVRLSRSFSGRKRCSSARSCSSIVPSDSKHALREPERSPGADKTIVEATSSSVLLLRGLCAPGAGTLSLTGETRHDRDADDQVSLPAHVC